MTIERLIYSTMTYVPFFHHSFASDQWSIQGVRAPPKSTNHKTSTGIPTDHTAPVPNTASLIVASRKYGEARACLASRVPRVRTLSVPRSCWYTLARPSMQTTGSGQTSWRTRTRRLRQPATTRGRSSREREAQIDPRYQTCNTVRQSGI